MGTRFIEPQHFVFDHAAQFFTVSDLRFSELVNGWIEKGLVKQWRGTVGEIGPGGQFSELPASPPRYIGVNGMRSFADSLLSEVIMFVFSPMFFSLLPDIYEVMHLGYWISLSAYIF